MEHDRGNQAYDPSKQERQEALRREKQEGHFKDIQTYKRAHGQDVKRKSKKERNR